MSVADGEYLEVDLEHTLGDGTICQNRYRYLADFGGGPSEDQDVLDAIEVRMEDMYGTLVGAVSADVDINTSQVSRIEWSVAESQWLKTEDLGYFTPTVAYASAVDALPNQCAPYVVAKTLRPRSMGRKFVLPFVEDTQEAGILSAGAVTTLTNWSAYYIAGILVEASNTLRAGIVREASEHWLTFVEVIVSDIIGTQRRRTPGRGV